MMRLFLRGVWRGLDTTNICASITNYDASFWALNEADCNIVIERQVEAYETYLVVGLYFGAIVYVLWCLPNVIRHVAGWRRSAPRPSLHHAQKPSPPLDSGSC